MRKILLLTRPICPPWDEASKNFAYTLAKHASDFEIHLLTCGSLDDLPQNVVQHDVFSSAKLDFRQKLRLFRFLKSAADFDIIHSLFTPTKLNSFFIKLALKNKKSKIVQTVATLREDLYNAADFKKILFSDQIITYSDYASMKLEKMGFQKVKRIYPGIDLEKYSPAPKKIGLMKKFDTGEHDFVINYTGEYVRLGDIDDIIDVFSEIANESKDFKLHLAVRVKNPKDAMKKAEIIKALRDRNIENRVAFIDDGSYVMEDIFNLADISIFPARTMAGKFDIPLAVIEAMACGKPVISSSLERLKYFLNNENSILIPPGNREALKENILNLFNDPVARNDLARRGMKFVRDNFDIMKVVKEYEKVYSNL